MENTYLKVQFVWKLIAESRSQPMKYKLSQVNKYWHFVLLGQATNPKRQ